MSNIFIPFKDYLKDIGGPSTFMRNLYDFLILEKSISRPARNIRKISPNDEKKSNRALEGIRSINDFPIITPIISSMTITGR